MACGATIKEDLYVNIENFAMKQVEMKRNYPFYGNQSTALLSKDKVSMKFHQIMSIFIIDQTQ